MKCPECKQGKIYKRKENETGFTISICYVCGYYEDDSEGYKISPESSKELFRKWFPWEARWLPTTLEQPNGTTKDGTEPKS